MTAFTRHPHAQGITYFGHWVFAMGIAWRLLSSVIAFALHSVLPFISIQPRLDLEAMSAYLIERNQFIETAAVSAHDLPQPRRAGAIPGGTTALPA